MTKEPKGQGSGIGAIEFVEHTADICLRVQGKTLNNLFQNALTGLFQVMRPEWTKDPISRSLHVTGNDRETLLVNFLNELIFNAETYREAYEHADFDKIEDQVVMARLHGRKTRGFNTHVKAATHHDLFIREKDGFYEGQVVFDV